MNKERRLALKSALSYKVINKEIIVLDDLKLDNHKIKTMLGIIDALKIKGTMLVVTDSVDDNLLLATSNLSNVKVITAKELNTYDVTVYNYLIITEKAIKLVEEVLL